MNESTDKQKDWMEDEHSPSQTGNKVVDEVCNRPIESESKRSKSVASTNEEVFENMLDSLREQLELEEQDKKKDLFKSKSPKQ